MSAAISGLRCVPASSPQRQHVGTQWMDRLASGHLASTSGSSNTAAGSLRTCGHQCAAQRRQLCRASGPHASLGTPGPAALTKCQSRAWASAEAGTCRQSLGRRQVLAAPLLGAALAGLLAQAGPASAGLIDEQAAKAVFSSAAQSVVSIADFRIVDGEEVAEGTGSGLVWDRYGHVVTNYHCVAKLAADKRGNQVTMVGVVNDKGNTQQFNATIKGLDPNRDIAVLQINAPAELLRPLKVGTSADLRVGQSVFAIGNPLGFSRTLTAGVVSGLDRIIPSPSGTRNYGAIQTDAAISKGNSGGPLLDSAGRLVGINTATFTRAGTGRSSGVNFALPVDMVRKVVPNLIVYGNSSSKM